jgi:hypothetical protein
VAEQRLAVFDFWRERVLGATEVGWLELRSHEARALLCTPVLSDDTAPLLVGNSFHLLAMVDGRIRATTSTSKAGARTFTVRSARSR